MHPRSSLAHACSTGASAAGLVRQCADGMAVTVHAATQLVLSKPLPNGRRFHVQAIKALTSHTDWIAAVAWHPRPAHHLATASQDSTVKLWDTRAAVPLHTISGHIDKVGATRPTSVADEVWFALVRAMMTMRASVGNSWLTAGL